MCGNRYKRRRFIRADYEAPGRVVTQFRQRVVHLALQVFESSGVLQNDAAGVGENQFPARPVDQLFSQLIL